MSSVDLDPRFDPRFQRGYDAERHGTVSERVAPDVVAASSVGAAPPVAASTAVAASPFVDELPDDGRELDDLPDEPVRRRNPYFLALIALPVVLLGAGAYLLVRYAGDISRGYGNSVWDDYTIITMVPLIAPALIATGFAALVVVLAQLALGRGRRG